MDQLTRQNLARALLGHGVAGQAADMTNWRAMYDQANAEAQMNGTQLPPIQQWVQQQQAQKNPNYAISEQ